VTRNRTIVALVTLALVCVLSGLGLAWWKSAHRSELDRAVSLMPAGTLRLSFTDWAGVREEVGAETGKKTGTETGTDPDAVRALMDAAFDADLSSVSSVAQSAPALQQYYGFSPATVEWEAFGQSTDGAAMAMRLPDDADFDDLADRLEGLGYARPGSDTGVWKGGPDVVAAIDPTLTPEVQYVVLLADQHLVLSSDTTSYLETARAAATGDADHLSGVDDLVSQAGDDTDVLAGVVFADDFACTTLAMSQASDEDQQVAQDLLEDAGKLNPLHGLLVAALPDRRLRVVMGFENGDQAATNADTRARLAVGEAPGKGDFADLFSLSGARSDGHDVVLDLRALPGQYALSALTSGPVLLETC